MKKEKKIRIFTAGSALLLAFTTIYSSFFPVLAAETPVQETQNSETTTPLETEDNETTSPEKEISPMEVTSIAPLSGEEAELFFDDKPALEELNASFPAELSVFLDETDTPVPLSVTWECADDYDNTEFDVYEFTPVWDTDAYPLASSFNIYADMPYIMVYVQQGMASMRLSDAAKAQEDLTSLAAGKDIYALLYLCDTYEVRQQPGKTEAAAATISTGQSVRITGVGEDSSYNIWYQASIDIGGSSYSGYIERDYLAYADEDLLAWEDRWISGQASRMAAPYALNEASPAAIPSDIAQFPASYQSGLLTLKTAHPNWIFVKMETGLDWKSAVQEENKNSRSLISSSVTSSWQTSSFDKFWSYPSDGILAYYMDPRNFLSENHIFQFELLSYNETYHKESAVQSILNGTFMSGAIPGDSKGQSYAQAFCNIARQLGVSPFHLASRVRQEQGDGTSPLISGTHPSYPGVYNYFNIGATGKGSAQVIENGLKKAAEYKWTTRYLSLEGGSNIISKDYIRKGQNTLYLQKFNVNPTSPSGLYQHQYMQNIAAPSSEAVSVKKAYATAGSLNNPFVFRIPVYKNMPSSACPQPAPAQDTIEKTDPPYTLPVLNTVTYAPGQTLANIKLPAGWTWDNPSIVPAVTNQGYPATFTPSDTSKYNIIKKTIPLTVQKGTPAYTVPSGLQASVGNTLSSIKLPVGFTWEEPSTALAKEGTFSYPASYNPDTANYQTITGIAVPVVVTAKAPSTCTSHSYGEWTVTVAATCTAPGTQTRSCLSCNSKETREVPASGHDYTSQITKEATETAEGIRTYTCSKCKDSYTETIAKLPASHKHSYSSSVSKQPSCTEKGIKAYTCSCGDTYSEEIPALGHNYTSKVTKEPTEAAEGIRTYTCSKCKDSYTETIAKLPASHKHSYSSSVSKQPSCTEKGIKAYTCSCGDTYSEEIPALGHDMADGKCRRCGYQEPQPSHNNGQANGSGSDGSSSGGGNTPANSNNAPSGSNAPANSNNAPSGDNTSANNASSGSGSKTPSGSSGKNTSPTSAAPASGTDGHTKNVTIDMKSNTVLYEETISSIRGQDIDVILNMGNSISWTINGSNIVADEANGIDMGITPESKNIPDALMAQASALSTAGMVIGLSLAHSGPLDFHPILTISTAPENAGLTANLYYYNPDSEQLEFTDAVVIDADGSIRFTFSHASDYVIIISETVMTNTSIIPSESSAGSTPAQEPSSEDTDADRQEDPLTEEESSGLKLTTIFLIAAMLLIAVAIGLTAFFLLRSRKGPEEEWEEEEDEDEDDEEVWEEMEGSSLDDGDPDDYREPKERTPVGNRPKIERDPFDDDEFDGFE